MLLVQTVLDLWHHFQFKEKEFRVNITTVSDLIFINEKEITNK